MSITGIANAAGASKDDDAESCTILRESPPQWIRLVLRLAFLSVGIVFY